MATLVKTLIRADANFPWILAIPPFDSMVFSPDDMTNIVQPYEALVSSLPGRDESSLNLNFLPDGLTCIVSVIFDTLENAKNSLATQSDFSNPVVSAQRDLVLKTYSDNQVKPYQVSVSIV